MSKDRWIFLVLGAIIGFLLGEIIFNRFEEFKVETIKWKDKVVYSDTTFYVLPDTKDTVYIDSTTRFLDMPREIIRGHIVAPVVFNKNEIGVPIDWKIDKRGVIYSIDFETKKQTLEVIEYKCKFDWKWPLIGFVGGILVMKIVD